MGAKSTLLPLGLGLLLSLLVASTAFTASKLTKKGVEGTSQCILHYLLLAFFYGIIMIRRGLPFFFKNNSSPLRNIANTGLKSILTVFDLLAKGLMIRAYYYTSLTSVILLGCSTIPCGMVLAGLFFKTKFGLRKLVGLAICVAGLVAVVLFDVHSTDKSSGINPFEGDLLAIIAATLYVVTNVCEEIFLKEIDHAVLTNYLGSYGACICGYIIIPDEQYKFMSILSSPDTRLHLIGLSLAMFLFYPGFQLLLKISGQRTLNVSLVTSSMWVILIQIFIYHEKVDWIYFVCFAAVMLGLIVCSGRDEMDPNNGEPSTIDEKPLLCHSDKVGISKNDESCTSIQGARNLVCHITCVIKTPEGDVRGEGRMVIPTLGG